ncbi:hypothetical protein COB21_03860 [Candidatus Aerophobetes bacterium]|uniref:VOC domain-containing protein n=1 Tax=Aerophobetes bacterium TaxID=2030807 RepID=A0A2A4X3R8_UNCAE|nr:MAG: hypothetical protein COB21_03860 [Candidatus Aerophobetes bacterium]
MEETKVATGLGMPCLTVSDVKKTEHLFVNLLGFEKVADNPEYKWMEFKAENGFCVGASEPGDRSMTPGSNATLTINVDNIEEAMAFLSSKGVNFTADVMEVPGHVKLVPFTDEDGNEFLLAQKLK